MKVSYKTIQKMERQLKDFFQEKSDFDVKLRTNDSIEQDLASELLLEGMVNGIMFMLHFAGIKYTIDEHQLGFEIDVEQTITKQLEKRDNKLQSFNYYINRMKSEILEGLKKLESDFTGIDSIVALGSNLYNIYGFMIVANILGCKLDFKHTDNIDPNLDELLKGNIQIFDDRDLKNYSNFDWLSYDDYKQYGKDLDDICREVYEISQIEDVNNSYFWSMDFCDLRKHVLETAEGILRKDKGEIEINHLDEYINLYTTRTLDNSMISMEMLTEVLGHLRTFVQKYFM